MLINETDNDGLSRAIKLKRNYVFSITDEIDDDDDITERR